VECHERGLHATLKKQPLRRDYEHLYASHHGHDLRPLRANGRRRLDALPGAWAEVSYEEGIARVSAPADVGIERLIERIESKGFKAGLSE
jgi:hypothetical protein